MPDFSQRSTDEEIMDDLNCHGEVVYQTLRELDFINHWLGGNGITTKGVAHLISGDQKEPLTIVDLGCGSGEILRQLADWARKKNLSVNFIGIDANPNIINFAKNHCVGYPEISFETVDIFSASFSERRFDIVIGTLFYHHFKNEELIAFFSKLKDRVKIGIVINDLHRHWLAFHSIRLLTRLFSKSTMVRYDAPLSVLRAFSKSDLTHILKESGIQNFRITWKWAFRWQVWHSFS
jgi:2-polyprenyl-3-methyl-5-hydroxy-6-metoxy-1,4-benzoquinol methylase